MREDKWHEFRESAIASIVLIFMIAVPLTYAAGAAFSAKTVTVAQTTSVSLTTVVSSTTASFTVTSFYVQTTTTYQTVTYAGPENVSVSGTATTKALGGTANEIDFTSSKGLTQKAQVVSGQFHAVLKNQEWYTVYIAYTGVAGGLGSGKCQAGPLPLFVASGNVTSAWSC